jgi:radical SAM protein with 4Fe4S-binding SPASM domain
MYQNIRKITEKKNELFILNKDGLVVKLPASKKPLLKKYALQKKLDPKAPAFIKELADLDLLTFENYQPKQNEMNFDDVLLKAEGEKPVYQAPIISHLAITSRCNMRCQYCSVRKIHQKYSQELSTSDYKKMIEKLNDWGVFQIGFTGGEPTLREDIVELTKYVSSVGTACNMTTNGWYLSATLARALFRAGMEQVQVSLDSHQKETHEKLRGEGSWSRALRTIELLGNVGMRVGIDCVVTKNNLQDIPGFIKFLAKRKIPGLTLIKLKKGDLPLSVFKKLVPDYQEYGELIARVCERENKMPEVTIDCGSVCNLHYSLTAEEQKTIHSAGCPVGHTLIAIAPNGDLYPCAALSAKKFRLGNLLTDDPEKIWHKNEIMRSLRDIKTKVKGPCQDCERLDSCRAGCRGIAAVLKGLYESDPTCKRKEVSK